MSKFHVGDRVRISQKSYAGHGMTGVVLGYDENEEYAYDVEFDEPIETIGEVDVFTEDALRPADIFALVVGKPSGEDGQYQDGDKVSVYDMVTEKAVSRAVDVVNHPPHYNRFPVEVINITEQLDFCLGNVVKYVTRAGYKDGVPELEDLKKAQWYLNRKIASIEES